MFSSRDADLLGSSSIRVYSLVENRFCRSGAGTSSANQCKVPADRRLIIEYASGFVFAPPSSSQTTSVTMAITDPGLGLNGAGFHVFPATKVNITPNTDVFAFTALLKMMLHPNATFWLSNVAGISVSGYLVNFTGP